MASPGGQSPTPSNSRSPAPVSHAPFNEDETPIEVPFEVKYGYMAEAAETRAVPRTLYTGFPVRPPGSRRTFPSKQKREGGRTGRGGRNGHNNNNHSGGGKRIVMMERDANGNMHEVVYNVTWKPRGESREERSRSRSRDGRRSRESGSRGGRERSRSAERRRRSRERSRSVDRRDWVPSRIYNMLDACERKGRSTVGLIRDGRRRY